MSARNGPELRAWRKEVMERCANTCQGCGATGKLDAHHIIPLAQTRAFAFNRANGVALCRKCHAKTESYANSKTKRFRPSMWGFIVKFIPHRWQDYATVGNYFQNSTQVGFLVSDTRNEKYNHLVWAHEFIEWLICRLTGVKMKAIDKFDMSYEAARERGDAKTPCGCTWRPEPGDDIHCPYYSAHQTATMCEKAIAREIGVTWDEYSTVVENLA